MNKLLRTDGGRCRSDAHRHAGVRRQSRPAGHRECADHQAARPRACCGPRPRHDRAGHGRLDRERRDRHRSGRHVHLHQHQRHLLGHDFAGACTTCTGTNNQDVTSRSSTIDLNNLTDPAAPDLVTDGRRTGARHADDFGRLRHRLRYRRHDHGHSATVDGVYAGTFDVTVDYSAKTASAAAPGRCWKGVAGNGGPFFIAPLNGHG